MKKIGVFTGTFDPFTIGHQNIADRAKGLFDLLIIAVAVSKLKHTQEEVAQRMTDIEKIYTDDPKIKVISYSDLTIEMCHREGAQYIVRGVRSVKDFEYEREQADINKQLGNIETILLF